VSAKITVGRYNLGDSDPALKAMDEKIVSHLRGVYATIRPN
jgi:hypothetical protein